MAISVKCVQLEMSPPVRVWGETLGGSGRESEYIAYLCNAVLSPTGKVVRFTFHGPRIVKKTGSPRGWLEFLSDDPGLNEVRLCARRIAAPASQRAESGAR